ncbi:MAG: hypothetical protein H7335_08470 [Massilia sp.]|nr:hypothetical protein [Massilia sp.]
MKTRPSSRGRHAAPLSAGTPGNISAADACGKFHALADFLFQMSHI